MAACLAERWADPSAARWAMQTAVWTAWQLADSLERLLVVHLVHTLGDLSAVVMECSWADHLDA